MTTIGFVGLGNMGGPMVARLLGTGYTVHVFDIDADALQTAVAAGAKPCTNAAECAAVADVFLTSLPRPDHVENVMLTNPIVVIYLLLVRLAPKHHLHALCPRNVRDAAGDNEIQYFRHRHQARARFEHPIIGYHNAQPHDDDQRYQRDQ